VESHFDFHLGKWVIPIEQEQLFDRRRKRFRKLFDMGIMHLLLDVPLQFAS